MIVPRPVQNTSLSDYHEGTQEESLSLPCFSPGYFQLADHAALMTQWPL